MGERTIEEVDVETKNITLHQCDFCGLNEEQIDEDEDDFVDIVVNPKIGYRSSGMDGTSVSNITENDFGKEEISINTNSNKRYFFVGNFEKLLHLCPFCGPAFTETLEEEADE